MHLPHLATRLAVLAAAATWMSIACSPLLAISSLVQIPGTAGCVSETGTGGACAVGRSIDQPRWVTVSPDGRNVYVVAIQSNAISIFDRHPATGALTQKAGTAGCIQDPSEAGDCVDGRGLLFPAGVAVSPDGRNVYVASLTSGAVVVFDRDLATGALTQKAGMAGCISNDGTGGDCAVGSALDEAFGVAVSPDGRNVYVASQESDAVAVFDRDATTGALTQKALLAACISQTGSGGLCTAGRGLDGAAGVVVSADGRSVYVTSGTSSAVAVFDRNATTGALTQKADTAGCISDTGSGGMCVNGVALASAFGIAASLDGRSVYVLAAFGDAVAIFDRSVTGELTQKAGVAGCISDDPMPGVCVQGKALAFPLGVALNPEGDSAYVAAVGSAAVAVFDRDAATGGLTQELDRAGCISDTGSVGACVDGVALVNAGAVATSVDGRNVYVASVVSDAVAVFARSSPPYDIDGDGITDPLVDGLLLVRYAFGFRGGTLINGAVNLGGCTRCTAELIEAFIEALRD